MPEELPDSQKEQKPEGPQPIEFIAILNPNGEWKFKCPLLTIENRIVMRGFLDEMVDTIKLIMAQEMAALNNPKIVKPNGGIMNFVRGKKRF